MGKVIPLDARERATKDAQSDSNFLETRTQKMLNTASEPVRRIAEWMSHPTWRWVGWVKVGLPMAAFLIGWMTNELGTDRVVNILAFPLLGLVLWNICVCGWMLWTEFRNRPAPNKVWRTDRMRQHLEKHLAATVPDATQREILGRTTMGFLQRWRERTAPLMRAQGKLLFHTGALLLAAGMVTGMYVQGLRKEYRAGWESTFLTPTSLHSLLSVVLGPASAVTSIPLPQTDALEQMRLTPGGGIPASPASAAPFIHLWAATAGLFIGLPRLLLIGLALKERRKAQPDWSVDLENYATTCKQAAEGQVRVVEVLPVYFTPESATAEAIRLCILQAWGGKTRVHFLSPIPLGEETEALENWQPSGNGTVLAFSFASTPEQEVQGAVIQQVQSQTSKLWVVTDALSFEARHGSLPEFQQRMCQREAAWRRVIGPTLPWLNLTSEVVKNPLAAIAGVRFD